MSSASPNTPDAATLAAARDLADQLVAWRRHLHQHPELSGQERATAGFVAERLREIGLEPQENVGDGYGVTAELRVNEGPFVALRADMDALPIQEANEVPYASAHDGVMHACGHDAHTSMLLGAAQLLSTRRSELRRNVRFVFQPHEELVPGGAPGMIAAGVLENVERIFGLHIWSQLPVGEIGTRKGPFMANPTRISIKIRGKGGHAAMPWVCVDPIVVGAELVSQLQTVVSRSLPAVDAAVLSITEFHAGTASNIIPQEAQLGGTLRTFNEAVRDTALSRIRTLAEHCAAAHGATAEVDLLPYYPTLINDGAVVDHALGAARTLGLSDDHIAELTLQGGGEDFAYYCREVPGAFVFVGGGNPSKETTFPHHHPRFNIDEDALPLGTALLAQFCLAADKTTNPSA